MGYRLSKKELRIIERTKLEGEVTEPDTTATTGGSWKKLKPYLFFVLIIIGFAAMTALLVLLTAG